MIIRPATEADSEAVCAIANWVIRDTLATFNTIEKTPQDVRRQIAASKGRYLVADQDGEILGHAHFFPFRSGPGYRFTAEHTIHLLPAAQGQGAGRRLMQALEEKAKEAQIHVLIASVSSANPAAIAFHAALGYVETARMPELGCKNGLWLDTVFMQKILTPGIPAPDSAGNPG
ncbi:GNAT family N-acetyltransferase [Leisingera aquaemixtae]|uniref:GNAT family N-acetyltransferase n=1 Tax=Leisingera aquaemixtae TaxID=1396826 RepID=UPI001C97D850|nr:GNAT family N-acetyltransferase [Leisingera aquaemixtae]MBY6067020.1 GNAT family N-acetyltransferase [Leisingera aquaemixtae]